MKKALIVLGLFVGMTLKANALTGPFVQITTGTLQPNTTNGFYVSSGTVGNFNVANVKSTGTWTINGSTTIFANSVSSGTRFDRSTTTFVGGEFSGLRNDNSTTTLIGTVFNGTATDNSTRTWTGSQAFSTGSANNFVIQSSTLSAVLISNSSGTFSQFIGGKGSATNDAAPSGWIGEFTSTSSSGFSAYAASGNWSDLVSMAVPAGDWDIWGHVLSGANGATNTQFDMGISVTTGNSAPAFPALVTYLGPSAATNTTGTISALRFSFSTPTTVYLKYEGNFSVATPQAKGYLAARRRR